MPQFFAESSKIHIRKKMNYFKRAKIILIIFDYIIHHLAKFAIVKIIFFTIEVYVILW